MANSTREDCTPKIRSGRRVFASTALAALVGSLFTAAGLPLAAQAAEGDEITGSIWHDYDANGVFDTYESGVAGIEVYAYDADGSVAGPATTGEDGRYVLEVTSDAEQWRVEANVADTSEWAQWRDSVVGRSSGEANGTTIQFVTVEDGVGATDVDFSFQVPSAHVENNPLVWVPVIQYGPSDGEFATSIGSSVMAWDAQSNAAAEPVPQSGQVPFAQVGATNGSAIARATDVDGVPSIFSAAFVRRHSSFGPGGIGAIYRLTPDGADWSAPTANATQYVDVTAFGIDLGGPDPDADPSDPNGLRPNVTADNPDYDWLRDAQAWNNVGRSGLGTIAFSADERYLFAVNLHNRSLIRIDTGGDPDSPPVGVDEFELDAYFPDGSDIRPYGVNVDPLTNTMYLSATDTAETSQDHADLHGYVYAFDPDAPADLTAVLDFPLDFARGGSITGDFQPWPTETAHYPTYGEDRAAFHPQPAMVDVQILHGDMILGVRDIQGDIFGVDTYFSGVPGEDVMSTHVRIEGDVFIAAPNGDGTFALESGGVHNGVTGQGAVQGQQGPGGLRYFETDYSGLNQGHEAGGSIVTVPSRDDGVLTTGVHVANGGQQEGFRRLFQESGQAWDPRGAVIRRTVDEMITSKGNGLGSASVLASAAPIEIGNYVWYDVDNDGIQDPDEPPVPGATVNLYEVGPDGDRMWVSSTTTDENGEYYFSSNAELNDNDYGLQTNTDYVVGIDNPDDYAAGGPLENWYPTVANIGDPSSVDADRNDSDGLVEETAEGAFPYAAITTGEPGDNDHTIDFGYSNIDYEFDKRTVSGPTENPDDDGTWVLEYELVAENTGVIDGSYGLTDDLTGYGAGIVVVDTEVISGPDQAALNPDWDGVDDQRVITADQPIAGQSTVDNGTEHVYLIRVTVALATDTETGEAAVEPGELTCTDGQGPDDATTGLFNVATMDPNNHEDLVDTECGDLPLVTLDKSVTVEPHVVDLVNNPGEYEITYGLTVTNESETATDYDLEDRLRFGEGISIVEGSVVAENVTPGDVVVNSDYNGINETVIVSDVPIAAGQVDTYSVTVRYTVDLPDAGTVDPDPSTCGTPGAGDEESGLFNDANTSFNGYPSFDDECREVGEVTHDKSLISADPLGDGQWEVVYGIEVTNKGVEAVDYDLNDELRFGDGITVVSAEVTAVPEGVTAADPEWDGLENLAVVQGVTILGTDDDGYAPQEYALTVIADVPLQLPDPVDGIDPATCGADSGGGVDDTGRAFNNVSTVIDEVGAIEDDDACAPLPSFIITKSSTDDSPIANGDGTWTVVYEIMVTNTGEADGLYDVTDRLRFTDEADIASASVTSTPDGVTASDSWTGQGADGAAQNVIASDVALTAGEVHVYQVQAVVAMVPEELSDEVLACPAPGSDENQGLANTAGLGHNDLQAEAEACVVPPQLEIDKTIVDGPIQDGGGYSISYQIEVTNTGGAQGSYAVSDQLRYGDGIKVDTAQVTDTPAGVSALETWTGQGADGAGENVIATGVVIDADETHVYLVTVTGTLDGDVVTAESLECGPDGAAGENAGLLNVAGVDHNSTDLTDDACSPLLPPDHPDAELPSTGVDGVTALVIAAVMLALLGALTTLGVKRRQVGRRSV